MTLYVLVPGTEIKQPLKSCGIFKLLKCHLTTSEVNRKKRMETLSQKQRDPELDPVLYEQNGGNLLQS